LHDAHLIHTNLKTGTHHEYNQIRVSEHTQRDAQGIEAGVNSAIQEGLAPGTILEQGLISDMDEVGKHYEAGEFF
jgi:methanogenic corrinoid protein MtbC1